MAASDLDCGDVAVVVRFVIPEGRTEVTVTEALSQAFEQSKEAGLAPVWVQEQEVLNLSPTKTDVFVMDPFSGPAFHHVTSSSKFKCTIVGPRCLLACLAANTPVPELPYPMYTAAMKGVIITISGLDKGEKEKYKQLVERMAGIYSNNFHDGVTHLVASKARSQKYEVAVQKEIPCMLPSWIEEVWKVSSKELVTSVDPRFSSFRCPALLGVTVSVSQLNKADKELLRKSVETHGGVYSGALEMDKTTVLVCTSSTGDKYSHAKKWKIPCVTSQWVFDSIERGYCLNTEAYRVDKGKTNSSTPTKQDQTMAGLAEVSMCSTILNPDETVGTRLVEDTMNCTTMGMEGLVNAIKGKSTADWLTELELGKVKKAGSFLDGCKIFLSGFTEPEQVQLTRVIKYSGAVRLTQLVESVTHCVHSVTTNKVTSETLKLLDQLKLSPYMVSIQWMVESMRLGKPVSEAEYIFPHVEVHSSFLPPPTLPEPVAAPDLTQYDAHLLAQYGGGQVTTGGDQTSQTFTDSASMSQVQPFLAGLTLQLVGFNEETQQDLTDWVTEAGGELVYADFTGVLDYLVVPVTGGKSKHKFKRIVSSYWLEDCLDAGELLDVQYHHHPLVVAADVNPLAGVVTCLSGYNGKEREYLNLLVTKLGGIAQEIFAKKDNKAKNAKGSTHLICPEGSGQKYEAAMKWGLPIVTRDWVTSCHRDILWVSEQPFLVGDSTTVTAGKPMPSVDTKEAELTVVEENKDVTITSTDANNSRSRRRESDEITFGSQVNTSGNTNMGNTSLPRVNNRRSSSSTNLPSGDSSTFTPVTAVKGRTTALDTPGPGVDTPTMERLRPKPLDLNNISVTPQRYLDSQPSPSQAVNKRKRDSTDSLDGMQTPNTPYGAHWDPNPSPHTRKYYKRMVDNMPRLELTELEKRQVEKFRSEKREDLPYFKHQAAKKDAWERAMDNISDPKVAASKHEEFLDTLEARGVPVIGRDDRTFNEIMEEKLAKQGKSWVNIGEEVSARAKRELEGDGGEVAGEGECKVLEGVVVMVAKKLSSRSQDLHRVVMDLGGEVAWQFSSKVTHFVFQGKQNDLTKEFRVAKDAGCKIVSPDWVYMCRDERERVQETTFPHTFNPRLKLDMTEVSSLSTTRTRTRNTSKSHKSKVPQHHLVEETNIEEDDHPNMTADDTALPPTETMKVTAEVSADLAEMDDMLDSVTKTPVPSSNRKVLRTVLTTQDAMKNTPTQAGKEKVKTEQEKEKESQVLWVDPQEEVDRKKLADQLNALETQDLAMETMESMGSMNIENLTAMMEDKENMNTKPKVFMVSGWTDAEPSVEEAVKKLGGSISLEGQYDPSATHMLAVKVSRSEKMLGSVAAGKWVLHPNYVSASLEAGKWLDERKYEWGNIENKLISDKEGMEFKLSSAARKWRLGSSGAEGAFSGMRFILHMPDNKKGPFSRLVKAGGGEVLSAKTPYSNTPGATHLLTEKRYIGEGQVDFAGLASRGVPVMKPIYLNDFLTTDPPPSVEQFLLEEFRSHWDSKKRSRVTTDTPTNVSKKTKSVFGVK